MSDHPYGIPVTKTEYKALLSEYNKATKEGKHQFVFHGRDILTSYAKYMLEYMKDVLDAKK